VAKGIMEGLIEVKTGKTFQIIAISLTIQVLLTISKVKREMTKLTGKNLKKKINPLN
jgi:hypothetical protein